MQENKKISITRKKKCWLFRNRTRMTQMIEVSDDIKMTIINILHLKIYENNDDRNRRHKKFQIKLLEMKNTSNERCTEWD